MMLGKANQNKEPAQRKGSGLAHLMNALHNNASNLVNSTSQLNGPDQILPSDGYTANRRNGSVKLRKEEHGLGSEEPISVPTLLTEVSEAYPEVTAFKAKRGSEWRTWTYEQYLNDVQHAARGFIQLGLHRHHSVAILGNNSPEWIISDLAAIFAGGIAVGMYIALSPEEIAKICIDSKADIIVVENEFLLKKVLLVQHKCPDLRAIVQYTGEPPLSDKRRLHRTHKKHIVSWMELMEVGHSLPEEKLDDRLKRVAINQCCTLIYTSGTHEPSKGVMLSHDNLTWSSRMSLGFLRAPGFSRMPAPGEETLLSFLPHSGIAAQTLDIYYTMSIAGTLCIICDQDVMGNTQHFFEAINEVQPTVFFAPPFIYERIYHKLRAMKRQMSGLSRMVLDWSSGTLRDKHLNNQNRIAATRKFNQWQTAVAKNTVCKKYKELLGFCPRSVFLSRGAPIADEVLRFLAGYDIVIHETFGQTENCGLLTANIPKRYCKLGTTGKAVPGVKVKIVPSTSDTPFCTDGSEFETGEICGWGRNIFMGYLNKEQETREIVGIEDHWLKMGDLGYIDNEGFTVVMGKSEGFITLNTGEVISPQLMEQLVRLELACIKQVLVVGDNQDYLAALLTLDTKLEEKTGIPSNVLSENAQKWFRHARFDMRTVSDVIENLDHGLQHVIQAGIDRVNQHARSTSHMLADWRIIHNQFTYQAGELGLTGKLKRTVIIDKHASCVKAMYINEDDPGHCSAGVDNVNPPPNEQIIHPHQLTLIMEEDDDKSSRNSVDRDFANQMSNKELIVQPSNDNEPHRTTIVVVESPVCVVKCPANIKSNDENEDKSNEDSASRKTSSASENSSTTDSSMKDQEEHVKVSSSIIEKELDHDKITRK